MTKKLLSLLAFLLIFATSMSYADDTANIKIRITGAMRNNNYFLCLPNVGCLSIAAAQQGKIYPVYHSIEMDYLSVMDVDNQFRVNFAGLPSSCNVTVQPNQTITIYGNLQVGQNNRVQLNNLHCSVAG